MFHFNSANIGLSSICCAGEFYVINDYPPHLQYLQYLHALSNLEKCCSKNRTSKKVFHNILNFPDNHTAI